jgi:MFS family permease
MIIVYMIFAVFFGTIHDKKLFDRRFLLCGAIIFWSAATALAGLSTNLVQLIALRLQTLPELFFSFGSPI